MGGVVIGSDRRTTVKTPIYPVTDYRAPEFFDVFEEGSRKGIDISGVTIAHSGNIGYANQALAVIRDTLSQRGDADVKLVDGLFMRIPSLQRWDANDDTRSLGFIVGDYGGGLMEMSWPLWVSRTVNDYCCRGTGMNFANGFK